jgi:hypoxanthine phosphoribosyltransferase
MEGIFKQSFDSLLGGSHTSYKKIERSKYSDEEKEIDLENKRTIQKSIGLLRGLRTVILETSSKVDQQKFLKEAHELATQTAQVIIDLSLKESPTPPETEYTDKLAKFKKELEDVEPGSSYSLPPQFSVKNLFNATEDILVRVKEKALSFKDPNHKLEISEVKYVLRGLTSQVNDLTIQAVDAMFSENSKVGGVLSGGAIYNEIVRILIEKYANPSIKIQTFVIAVDKIEKKSAFELSDTDDKTTNVIIVDDVINNGGTILTALWSAGEHFPNARIRTGKGTDYPGGWEKRKNQKHYDYLSEIYQDFSDLAREGKGLEAMEIYAKAEAYAKENSVNMSAAWDIVKNELKTLNRI